MIKIVAIIDCVLSAADPFPLLIYHALICTLSLHGGSHLHRGRILILHVRTSNKENREQHNNGITKSQDLEAAVS